MSIDRGDYRTPTNREIACFEAGVKFGSLYHQFAGTPLSPDSADDLARAMETAIENQPHCTDVAVEIDEVALEDDCNTDHGYVELTGRYLDVEIRVRYEDVAVVSRMAMEGEYPLMRVESVTSADEHPEGD